MEVDIAVDVGDGERPVEHQQADSSVVSSMRRERLLSAVSPIVIDPSFGVRNYDVVAELRDALVVQELLAAIGSSVWSSRVLASTFAVRPGDSEHLSPGNDGITLRNVRTTAMRTISIKLQPELDARITKLAKTRGTTRSALVRQAIESIDLEGTPGSFLALAGDLAGSVQGSRDLSTGAKHMAGYGE